MKPRYLPIVQQPYCCVAACFQMVMYRHRLPLIPQEELAYELGLIVPEKDSHLFAKVRTGSKPSSGWGTQIQKKEFKPAKVFKKLKIPLEFNQYFIKDFKNPEGLKELLVSIQKKDTDGILCFDYGKLWGIPSNGGHVCVFDRIDGNKVHIVDPEYKVPKFRIANLDRLFKAMDFHGDSNSTGVWILTRRND